MYEDYLIDTIVHYCRLQVRKLRHRWLKELSWEKLNNVPPNEVHILILRTCGYIISHGKRPCGCNLITKFEMGENILDYVALPSVIIRVFKRVGTEMETEVRVMWPGAKEYRQLIDV